MSNRLSAVCCLAALAFGPAVQALDFTPREIGFSYTDGRSPLNRRGHSIFHTFQFEVVGTEGWLARHVPGLQTGASISYSDITQARSWFGYTYGDPNDRVRGETAQIFVRRALFERWSVVQPYAELGSGPMWSNRRVPAATSRFNFSSYFVAGATFFPDDRWPVRVGYRFSHVSDGGISGRNPGLNVHSFFVGTRIRRFRGQ